MKQGPRIEVQASKQPNTSQTQGGNGITNNQTLHQSNEANQLKRGEVNQTLHQSHEANQLKREEVNPMKLLA